MTSRKIVVGNLKMNMETISMRENYLKDSDYAFKNLTSDIDVVLCPQTLYIERFLQYFQKTNVKIGSQDCFWETYGSYTGQVSPKTIKSIGVNYAIIGHSERRDLGESDEQVAKKCAAALRVGLIPIVCVGYTDNIKDETIAIGDSIKSILNEVSNEELHKIIFAYEPVWAIGSGKIPSTDDIHTMVIYIKKLIMNNLVNTSESVKILYGGSVSPENISNIMLESHVDGVLVGGVSLQIERFAQVIKIINNLVKR